jgi:tetratricopeptide (TPR) repeat protein
MKIVVLILFVVLILLSVSAILFLLATVVGRVRRGKSNLKKSSGTNKETEGNNFSYHLLAEYYGGITNDSSRELRELFNKGLSFKQKRKFVKAINVFEECLNGNLTSPQKTGILVTMGNCYFALEKFDSAGACYRKAEGFSIESNDENGRLSCLINLGLINATGRMWDEAIGNYHQAIGLDRKLGHAVGEAIDLNTLALFYENKEDFNRALEHYTTALSILERLKDGEKAKLVENNIRRVNNLRANTRM